MRTHRFSSPLVDLVGAAVSHGGLAGDVTRVVVKQERDDRLDIPFWVAEAAERDALQRLLVELRGGLGPLLHAPPPSAPSADDIDADIVLRPSISSLRGLADDSGTGREVHNRSTVVLQVRVRGEHEVLRCLEPGAEGQIPVRLLQIRKRLLPGGVRVVDHAGQLAKLGGSQLDGLVRGLRLAHVTVDEDDVVAEVLL